MTRQTRREHLYSIGAGASTLTLASLAPTTDPGILGWEAPDSAVPHSNDRFSWIIPVEGADVSDRKENLDALEDELPRYDGTQILSERRHDAVGTLTAVAPVDAIGARNRDRWLNASGIASLEYIDESGIEINRKVTLADPLTPEDSSVWGGFNNLESLTLSIAASGVPDGSGVAFDSDMDGGEYADARAAMAATSADTSIPDTSNVTVIIEDTGVTDRAYLDDADGNSRLRTDSINVVEDGDPTGRDAVADDNGHGDWIAGAYAARMPNDPALEAPGTEADVVGIKALDSKGGGELTDIAAGIRYAADTASEGSILNLSLGSPKFSQSIENALEYAVDNGIIPIAAAGNDRQGSRFLNYPASSQYTIAVGATTVAPPAEAQSAYYSNVSPQNGISDLSGGTTEGAMIDVAAPGCKLKTPEGAKTGTSMAGPAAGSVGMLDVAAGNASDLETLRERLRTYAEPIPNAAAEEVGAGMPSAKNMLEDSEPETEQADAETTEADARGGAYRTVSGNPVLNARERAANFL